MGFPFKQKRELVDKWLEHINEIYNEDYKISYIPQYGGFQLYKVGEGGSHYGGYLGFNGRMPINEFLAYLQGIIGASFYLKK